MCRYQISEKSKNKGKLTKTEHETGLSIKINQMKPEKSKSKSTIKVNSAVMSKTEPEAKSQNPSPVYRAGSAR